MPGPPRRLASCCAYILSAGGVHLHHGGCLCSLKGSGGLRADARQSGRHARAGARSQARRHAQAAPVVAQAALGNLVRAQLDGAVRNHAQDLHPAGHNHDQALGERPHMPHCIICHASLEQPPDLLLLASATHFTCSRPLRTDEPGNAPRSSPVLGIFLRPTCSTTGLRTGTRESMSRARLRDVALPVAAQALLAPDRCQRLHHAAAPGRLLYSARLQPAARLQQQLHAVQRRRERLACACRQQPPPRWLLCHPRHASESAAHCLACMHAAGASGFTNSGPVHARLAWSTSRQIA